MNTSIGVKRSGKKAMRTSSLQKPSPQSAKPLRYICAAGLLIVGMVMLKGAIAWLSERFVYTLPILGGLLKSLELVEVSNVVVFAVLGVGLGAFTQWLPKQQGLWVKSLPLVVAVPIIFLTGYAVRHYLWVEQVAVQSELLPAQAQEVTDDLLVRATGQPGLWGYFRYTVQTPIVPTDLSTLKNIDKDDKWFRSELTRLSGVEPGIFTRLFRWSGWGIRIFYTLLALVTSIIYFTKGLVWAHKRRK